MKLKVLIKSVTIFIISCICQTECMLYEEEFFEYYITGTSNSLSYLSEKALKFVSSSSEDLQRLYLKEVEVRDLIERYRLSIENIANEIRMKAEVSTNREHFVRKIRKVTKTYYRPSEEFENTGGLGIVKLDDVHEFNKMEFADGTIDLPIWGARLESVHKLGVADALLLSHTAGKNQLLNRQVEWLEVACKLGERVKSDKLEYLKNYLKTFQKEHDQLILEKGFSIAAEGEAQGFVITNKQPYNQKLKKHKKMKRHIQDLKNEDQEYKFFRHLVHGRRLLQTEDIDFKKWNELMYLKVRTDISKLCVGTETKSSIFKCHVHKTDDPFIKLSPFKVEIFYDDPEVAMIHDFISGKESSWIKGHVRGRMRAATYFQKKTKTLDQEDTVRVDFSADRTSKTRFVADSADPKVKTISERINYATNWHIDNNLDVMAKLDMGYWASQNMNSENFRVMNYAPGGWVSPHIDTGGDGISSFMFYLSSGVIGGHTIFPMLDLAIKPKPNAALVWYGRDQAGVADIRSLHVGCPVVYGNKWAALKLVQYNGQWDNTQCRQGRTFESIPLFTNHRNGKKDAFEGINGNSNKTKEEKMRIMQSLKDKMAQREGL